LGWALLTDDLLEKRKLVRPLDATVRSPKAFYLVTSDRSTGAEVRAFREWVLEQFELTNETHARPLKAVKV
ncbi:MAG: hypothetical protein WBM28_10625, partial [Burkholderiales bacterium]